MSYLDDLPKSDDNRLLQEQSEEAFRSAISDCSEFVVQSEDRQDYGTDYQIEARDGRKMTNVRVHVQLKGTRRAPNTDGSVSVSVKRTTLSYLVMQPSSLFVCYHAPQERLLVRRADDVLREYEHGREAWVAQATVTVKFRDAFSRAFLRKLKEYVVASARGARDHRHFYASQPPEDLAGSAAEPGVDLPVPAEREGAEAMLEAFYDRGRDRAISSNFEKFRAVLGPSGGNLVRAYMAEINLGVNGQACDKGRIAQGIEVLQDAVTGRIFSPGSMLYCVGNGWLALGDYRMASGAYEAALKQLDEPDSRDIAARCCKNLGSAKEKMRDAEGARALYGRALELDGGLAEAHLALALSYRRGPGGLEHALEHLDAIVCSEESAVPSLSVQGWRVEVLFELGRIEEAFRDIRALQGRAREAPWVLPWCARLVATYGRASVEAARHSLRFWDACAGVPLGRAVAVERERLLCVFLLQTNGERTAYNYEKFKRSVEELVARGAADPAFLWDRCGHWAQGNGDWGEAEECYRRAFELSEDEYGYCLGTALNFLGRHEEALPILLPQTKEHEPDALSWFQVAVASEGTGDIEGSVDAYRRALRLDEDYALAWFNLGGLYWKSDRVTEAATTWKEAVRRFPAHELAAEVRRMYRGC